MPFEIEGLFPEFCRAVEKAGYKIPFPVQSEVIPHILSGKDLAVSSKTGSGKTLAFLLPIIQRLTLVPEKGVSPTALILVPTRELALQVEEVGRCFAKSAKSKIKVQSVHGGVSINPQLKSLSRGAEILIATPGRLIDITEKNGVDLSFIEIFVLDEADRMLNLGFRDELKIIMKMLPEVRQNLLFSATIKDSMKSSMPFLNDALFIDVEESHKSADPVKQICYRVSVEGKGVLLRQLINEGGWKQVLVFAASKRRADNITRKLCRNGIKAEAFHGDKSQGARIGALKRFKEGSIRVLVATDLASRGLDITELPYVVNYELPRSVSDYIHRIGRTGRAGVAGVAVTLLSEDDEKQMKLIEKKTGVKVEYVDPESEQGKDNTR